VVVDGRSGELFVDGVRQDKRRDLERELWGNTKVEPQLRYRFCYCILQCFQCLTYLVLGLFRDETTS